MDDQIFKLIDSDEKKIILWEDLSQSKSEIICKGQQDAVCRLRIKSYDAREQIIQCDFESPTQLQHLEEYLASFLLGGEKYYFRGKTILDRGRVLITLPPELFHLQRRQSYRVRIPELLHSYYNIILVNESPFVVVSSLVDLSSHGCRISSDPQSYKLQKNDKVTGLLIIDKKPPLEINGIIRHTRVIEGKTEYQISGVEFQNIPTIIESKIFSITMEIHKQFFRRPI